MSSSTAFDSATLERLHEAGLAPDRIPQHVAVIMDGNGRWAQLRGQPRIEGHRRGVVSVRSTVEECCKLGIGQLTLYCLSIENWKRPKIELDFLMELLHQYFGGRTAEIMDQNIRFTTIGRREELPDNVLEAIDENVRMSAANTGMILCLAINYGGRAEVVDAVRRIAGDVQAGRLAVDAIDEDTLTDAMYTAGMSDPDLLIRTAGEMRVSNFLLWQISYAELWVTEKCWPDFDRTELHAALRAFGERERRFGGLKLTMLRTAQDWCGPHHHDGRRTYRPLLAPFPSGHPGAVVGFLATIDCAACCLPANPCWSHRRRDGADQPLALCVFRFPQQVTINVATHWFLSLCRGYWHWLPGRDGHVSGRTCHWRCVTHFRRLSRPAHLFLTNPLARPAGRPVPMGRSTAAIILCILTPKIGDIAAFSRVGLYSTPCRRC